ncbi:MAG: arginine--tRNA ligase [Deltaproteobacteria bacterium]|nr:MAG: arginine--tRNA ligase [Deltaproteobacteria bacterium]
MSTVSTGHLLERLSAYAEAAMREGLGIEDPNADVRPATNPRFGDYQINGVLPYAKALKANPRQLAQQVVDALDTHGVCLAPEIAGPGFINLRLDPAWVAREVAERAFDPRLGIAPVADPQKIIVDFSSPNVAKRMHVGHLRSTAIGDAIVRTLKFLGHDVVGDNHVGDWGTQFGIILWGWKHHRDEAALERDAIGELERLYKLGQAMGKDDPAIAEAARLELAKLQAGDPENKALWERFVAISRAEAEDVYRRLEVEFDTWNGESHYNDALPGIVDDLVARGLAVETRGAIGIFFDEPGLPDTPYLIRKSDGAFLYATTDIATIHERVDELGAERIIYVVDVRQSDHFRQLFATCRKIGYDKVTFEHVGFGMMLGADGRPFKTRDGGTVLLESLLDEAEERILPMVQEKWPEASEEDQRAIAAKVGMGAVKYADLAQNLGTDYKFEWDKLLAADGNTGPYLQYTLVRTLSVFREYEARFGAPFDPKDATLALTTDEERDLAFELVRLGDVIERVGASLRPHFLCEYTYNLARRFNAFYANCPILKAEELLASRMTLTRATWQALEVALTCLNIPRVQRM